METASRKFEYKLSLIVGSCLTTDHLQTARECILKAIDNNLISAECATYLKVAIQNREIYIRQQSDFIDGALEQTEADIEELKKVEEPVLVPIESDGTAAE